MKCYRANALDRENTQSNTHGRCKHAWTHWCMHTQMHTCTHTQMHAHTQRCAHACTHTHTHMCATTGNWWVTTKKVILPFGRRQAKKGSIENLMADLSLMIWIGTCQARRYQDDQAIKEGEKRHKTILFIYSFNKCLSNAASVLGIVLSTRIQQ